MAQTDIPFKMEENDLVPRFLVRAMLGLIAFTVLTVGYAQLTGKANTGVLIEAPIVAERTINLIGTREGAVTVTDMDGNLLTYSTEDKNGFIGVVWRVFDRQRFVEGVEKVAPVRVVRRENGNIAVIDTETDMVVELIGYGSDNVAAFAKLID
jgi:putative photosynthetic complex assembly protein